jgi:hypothetical protein
MVDGTNISDKLDASILRVLAATNSMDCHDYILLGYDAKWYQRFDKLAASVFKVPAVTNWTVKISPLGYDPIVWQMVSTFWLNLLPCNLKDEYIRFRRISCHHLQGS